MPALDEPLSLPTAIGAPVEERLGRGEGTRSGSLQPGHLAFLPAYSARTAIFLSHDLHLNLMVSDIATPLRSPYCLA